MDSIQKLKSLNLTEHISKYLWQGKNETTGTRFKSSAEDKTPSLLVYKDNTKWYYDYSGKLGGWSIIDFQMNYFNQEKPEAIKTLCEQYWMQDDNKKEFKKAVKRYKLVEDFDTYKLSGWWVAFTRFLQTRWVSFDDIKTYKDTLNNTAKELWFCENQWVDDDTFRDVMIFPCYDIDNKGNQILCWAKLRRTDWEKIKFWNWYVKSITVWKPKDYTWSQVFSTWLLFSEISEKYVLIVEWETDYIILKMLGFKSVIWNLWWVSANADKIQQLVKKVDKVVCMYDNDPAWEKATIDLQEKIGRPIRKIIYPKIEWTDKYDVNDLFNMWYKESDFKKLIKDSILLNEEQKLKDEIKQQLDQPLYKDRFFYNATKMEYFDVKDFSFKTAYSLARHLFIKQKELEEARQGWVVPTYEWVCYLDWWMSWYYNLLDKSKFLTPSKTAKIHPEIEELLINLCWENMDNYEWLLKAILYKYTHLNDVLIPAVVFHGIWGTWKWLFVKLLAKIFWENNTQIWLTQDSIESRFSAYSWQKLIVEFKELSVDNTAKGKKNMNKLKTFIMEDKIQIEKKWQDPVGTENIAWFIMSSNENKPVHLDSRDSWNRRFTIMRTWKSVWLEKGWKIAEAIKDDENIENFLAYLFEMFPDIPESKNIQPLDNEDKRDLEYLSESVWNLFFRWVEKKYPNINKITNEEQKYLLDRYCVEFDEDIWDERYKKVYFNQNLSVRYKPCVLRLWDKTKRGYKIDKEVQWEGSFPDNFFSTISEEKVAF